MQKSDTLKELATSLAKAQSELENATKSTANAFFKSKYADLAECLNTVRPVFSKHGLSISQFPTYENGIAHVETILLHSSGEWLSNVSSAPVGKQDAQGVGSATTYLRRYALAAIAGITQEDDDANHSVGKQVQEVKHIQESKIQPIKYINIDEQAVLIELLKQANITEKEFLETCKIHQLNLLNKDRFQGAKDHLTKIINTGITK